MLKRLRSPAAAAYLDMKDQTLRAHRQRGDGPKFIRIARNRIVYDIEELERWLAERTFSSTAEARLAPRAPRTISTGSSGSGQAPAKSSGVREPRVQRRRA